MRATAVWLFISEIPLIIKKKQEIQNAMARRPQHLLLHLNKILFLLFRASRHDQVGGGFSAGGDWAGGRPELPDRRHRGIETGEVACAGKKKERVVTVRVKI